VSEGWKTVSLDEICDIARGGSPRPIKEFITDAADGVNWIKIGDATASNKYIYKTKQKIKREGIQRSRFVQAGDFLLSNSMSFGRPYIMKTSGCIHDGWLVLSDKSGAFNQDYLYYFLGSNAAYKQFDELAAGSTVRNLNIGLVKRVKVLLPALTEQKRIVSILDEAFKSIDQAITNTEKNLTNARELFESYLNNVFNYDNKDPLVSLSEVTSCITDGDHSAPPKAPSGIPFITISNIDKNTKLIDFSNTFKVPKDYFNKLKHRKPINGDVLYTVTGSYGIPVKVPDGVNFCFQRHIGLLRPKPGVNSSWLYYALLSPMVYRQATDGATGTAQKTVSLKLLRSMIVPSMNERKQASIVRDLDDLCLKSQKLKSIFKRKSEALNELKQSLLQKAFSGQLS